MQIYLIRHGQSEWNRQNRIQGNGDSNLTEQGIWQARCLAERLKGVNIDIFYSSPLLRCHQTASIVAKLLRKEVYIETDLREISLGEWEGKTPEEIDRIYAGSYQRWLALPSSVEISGSEPIARFRQRAKRIINRIIRENKKKEAIAIFTHGGIISAYLAEIIDANIDKLISHLSIENTGINIIECINGFSWIRLINDVSHLSVFPGNFASGEGRQKILLMRSLPE